MSPEQPLRKVWLFLALLAFAAFAQGFFTIPPFDRDESRYVQASHQMLETGDFIDIRFQEEARHKKPVGIYWMQAATVHLLTGGQDTGPVWMYRLPSLIGAIVAVLLTAWAGLALFGPGAGAIAAMMMATCVILGVEARMAKTDAVQLACVLGCMGVLARAYLRPDRALPLSTALLFWVALGIGVLVKGVILMVVGAAILALWLIDREVWWLRRLRPALGLLLFLAIILPWLIAIAIATKGAFFGTAVGHEFLGKAATGQENHAGPPGYFLATFWLSFWPWAPLVLLSVPLIWARRHEAAVRFCLAWIIPTWAIHEAVVTKLPHYTLPVLPALALLAAAMVITKRRAPLSRDWVWAAIAMAVIVSLAFAGAIIGFPVQMTGQVQAGSVVAALSILAVGGLTVWLVRSARGDAALGIAVAAVIAYIGIFAMALPGLTPMWLSPQVKQVVDEHKPCSGSILAAGGYNEPSMVFLVGTATRLGGGELVAAHLLSDPACAIGMVTTGREEAAFQAALRAAGREPRMVAELSGFNYSRGKPATLHFYLLSDRVIGP
ncbi:glycosyltransferase family 39 protein [Niveispirillum sp.]|uniref:ArnT family glycosyltransferase n=1 Tax=Niveispirillum sp. TaxID=1917217 RepID=UPI001B4A2D6B|nr:glycosyltransferase family 39 protein [Niveispirillum sp.]MBP7339368.1 glycosyltransferase family 39 protein [Niveispirillum sp.]